jgi:hypothetical protein
LWIIQEVVLASKIQVQCGQLTSKWSALSQLFMDIDKYCEKGKFTVVDNIRDTIPATLDR